jgi:hypothetical protein
VLASTADGTGTYVVFETVDRVPFAKVEVWVGTHARSGRFSSPRRITGSPNQSVRSTAAVLARDGRWRAFVSLPGCVDTACGSNQVLEVTDTGASRVLTSQPNDGSGNFVGTFRPLDAAYLPGDVVALIGRDDDSTDAVSPVRDRGPLWFGRGAGTSWPFAALDARTDITSSDLVGRYGGLFVVYGRPGQVVDLTSDGRRWAAPRTLPATGRASGVVTAVSLGRQFVAWDDAAGLHLASRTLPGPWTTTTVTRAGQPRSLAVTAVGGKATVIYGVTTVRGLEVRSTTQR